MSLLLPVPLELQLHSLPPLALPQLPLPLPQFPLRWGLLPLTVPELDGSARLAHPMQPVRLA